MKCAYCDTPYTPGARSCASCGAVLPVQQTRERHCSGCGAACAGDDNFCAICGRELRSAATAQIPQVQHIHINMSSPGFAPLRGPQCPRCGSFGVRTARRGYSWGLGLLGFFLVPFFGLILGAVGSGKTRCTCPSCRSRWTVK